MTSGYPSPTFSLIQKLCADRSADRMAHEIQDTLELRVATRTRKPECRPLNLSWSQSVWPSHGARTFPIEPANKICRLLTPIGYRPLGRAVEVFEDQFRA